MNARTHHPLADAYASVRAQTLALAAPLSEADCQVQSMPDASPVKWHLAHTTWFFETFVLVPAQNAGLISGYQPAPDSWGYLFNSYYDAVGERIARGDRGLLSRPPIASVLAWRQRVDGSLQQLLEGGQADAPWLSLLELGLQHCRNRNHLRN
jgi:hypothetical protein